MDKVIDHELSLELAGGDQELANDLLAMLIKELPDLRDKLQQTFDNGDMDNMLEHAHKIVGSTRYIGVPALAISAGQLEKHIKENNTDSIPSALEQVNNDIDRILDESS